MIPAAEGSVPVIVAYDGVGHLHQGFFNTPDLVEAVSSGLGGCVTGTAEVVVSYNAERRIGGIVLHSVGDTLACKASVDGSAVDLRPLIPIARALAAYRDGVANRFDLRIGSFRSGIRVLRGTQVCEVWLGGQYPPDGSTFSPCVHLQGHEKCMSDDRTDGVVSLQVAEQEALRQLAACFR